MTTTYIVLFATAKDSGKIQGISSRSFSMTNVLKKPHSSESPIFQNSPSLYLVADVWRLKELPPASGPANWVHVGPQRPIQTQGLEVWVGAGHIEEVLGRQVGEDLQEKFVGEGQQP